MYGAKVREARRMAGLTQAALAGKLGVTQAHLSRVESGKEPPLGPRSSAALSEAMGGTREEWTCLAAGYRRNVSFSLEVSPKEREVVTRLWARYREMTEEDWERVGRALDTL